MDSWQEWLKQNPSPDQPRFDDKSGRTIRHENPATEGYAFLVASQHNNRVIVDLTFTIQNQTTMTYTFNEAQLEQLNASIRAALDDMREFRTRYAAFKQATYDWVKAAMENNVPTSCLPHFWGYLDEWLQKG